MPRTRSQPDTLRQPSAMRRPANCPTHCGLECLGNHQFTTMLGAFQATGGLARVEDVVERMRQQNAGPTVDSLVGWIGQRQVICFEWRTDIWLPWFQFHRTRLVPHPQLAPVFEHLASVYEPWEIANWFARPNPWLADRTPVDAMIGDVDGVLHAARADQFIANG